MAKHLDFNLCKSSTTVNEGTQTEMSFFMDSVQEQAILDDIIAKMPTVCEFLYEKDDIHTRRFIQYLQLLENKQFPMNNICYMTFLYIIEFLSLSSDRMQYSEATKIFWYVGYKQFHNKLINILKGKAHDGDDVDKSTMNFSIPSRKTLSSIELSIKDKIQPGILIDMIDEYAKTDVAKTRSHNLSCDLKGTGAV